ncbi:hypothetical protein ACO0RG_004723 [Hanseniaspora osmophila]
MALSSKNVIDLHFIADHDDQQLMDMHFKKIIETIFFQHNLNWFVVKNYILFDKLLDDLYDLNGIQDCLCGHEDDDDKDIDVLENAKYVSVNYHPKGNRISASRTRDCSDAHVQCDIVYKKLHALLIFFEKIITRILTPNSSSKDTSSSATHKEHIQMRTLLTKQDETATSNTKTESSLSFLPNHLFTNHEFLWSFISLVPVVQDLKIKNPGNDKEVVTLSCDEGLVLFHVNHKLLKKDFVNFKYFTNSSTSSLPFTVLSYTNEYDKMQMCAYNDAVAKDLQIELSEDVHKNTEEAAIYNCYKLRSTETEMIKLIKKIDSKILFAKFDFANNDSKLLRVDDVDTDLLQQLLYVWPTCYTIATTESLQARNKVLPKNKVYIDYYVLPQDLNSQQKRLKRFKQKFSQVKHYKDIKTGALQGNNACATDAVFVKNINVSPGKVTKPHSQSATSSPHKRKTVPTRMNHVLASKSSIFKTRENSTHAELLQKVKAKEEYNRLNFAKNQQEIQENCNRMFENNLQKIEKILFVLDKTRPYSINKLMDLITDSLSNMEMLSTEEIERILMELHKRNVVECVDYNGLKIFNIIDRVKKN